MVQSNLRLVVSNREKIHEQGAIFQDLIQEGSLGLIRAAEKFDHEKGYKFLHTQRGGFVSNYKSDRRSISYYSLTRSLVRNYLPHSKRQPSYFLKKWVANRRKKKSQPAWK
jgi:hypothetical protein